VLRDVVVVVAEPVPTFELGAVCEAFGIGRFDPALPRYRFAVCALEPGPHVTTSGFKIIADHDLGRLDSADLIVVTGAPPPLPPPSAQLIDSLRQAVDRGARVASVCTGAFVLAAAGLLDHRQATTHWAYADLFARQFPLVQLVPDRLYVIDGPVATSAGSAAAMDLCLQLVRDAHGADIANRVARDMVFAAHRSGGQAQFVQTPLPAAPAATDLSGLLDWARAHLADDLSVRALAAEAAMSPRGVARHFHRVCGTTPASWVRSQRIAYAEQLLEAGELAIASVAARCGLGSPDTLRRHFMRARGITPEQYRRTFRLSSGHS
jgi:AraC family transcriptional activator FtrA